MMPGDLAQARRSRKNIKYQNPNIKWWMRFARPLEVASKPSIGFKAKAERGVQPQEYFEYFEDWTINGVELCGCWLLGASGIDSQSVLGYLYLGFGGAALWVDTPPNPPVPDEACAATAAEHRLDAIRIESPCV